ncbi:DUF4157 domain-containing protein [Nocardia sp. CDC159]|uniref:DUF4157 domain-containing protein n=1 Tax=Nocardia pulmonis TaxID=2951408 RepID=A0A9X2EEF2_9NOCA|nr:MULTISPECIES: DUF4157 domain-containing protein [Nocardia]MCM6776626.1 DUF4157 domain-containing protein [Nocardia pulmonis]MCM6789225.1 DUF4157 domain-containing protein [Nocardia sp. CDC159]
MPEHAHLSRRARSATAPPKSAAGQEHSRTTPEIADEPAWYGTDLAAIPLRMTTPSDRRELAATAPGPEPHAHGSEERPLRPEAESSVRAALSEPSATLPAGLRRDAETRLGADFSDVRIHTGPRAESSARAVDAAAYTVGSHIVFGAGRFAPDTRAGRQTLTHELTHVAQQARGSVVLARQPADQDDPDAKVSLGALDNALVTRAGEAVLGPTSWTIAREFLRGLRGGLASVEADQQARIDKKFDDFGPINAAKYAGGYLVGLVIGLGQGLWGLVEGLWTLVTLPYKTAAFAYETLPPLAAKYGPRLEQALAEGGGIKGLVADLLKNPKETWQALSGMAELVAQAALAKVRSFGRGAAKDILALAEEDWYSFGRDIGKVVGRVLFEIVLLVASDAIGNIVKGAAELAGRIAARAVEGVVTVVRAVGRMLGQAVEWVARIGKSMSGRAAEVFEKFKALLGKLRALMAEMLPEVAETNVGGVEMPVPDTKGAAALESRALPTRTAPAKVSDLVPPKVHPSKAGAPGSGPRKPGTPSQFTDQEIAEELADVQAKGKHLAEQEASAAPRMRETGAPKGAPPQEAGIKGDIGEVRGGGDPFARKTPIWVGKDKFIPDVLDQAKKVLVEIKNVTDLGRDARAVNQISAYAKWAKGRGYTFDLIIDNRTKLGPVIEALEQAGELTVTRKALL